MMDYHQENEVLHENRPTPRTRKSYSMMTFQVRKQLVRMVFEDGLTTYRACKILKINYSTGKSAIKKYKIEGTVFKRKSECFQIERPQNILEKEEVQVQVKQQEKAGKILLYPSVEHCYPIDQNNTIFAPTHFTWFFNNDPFLMGPSYNQELQRLSPFWPF